MHQAPRPSARVYVALGLVTASALLLEVTLVRLLSVALWYPVAFVVLATAMLGFGAAAVLVALWPRLRATPTARLLPLAALAFSLTALGGYPLWNALPVDPMSLVHEPLQLLWVPLLFMLVAAPFACAGLFVAATFSSWPAAAARLYAADLLGASLGVLAYVAVMPRLGGPGTLALVASCGGAAALALYPGAAHRRLVGAGLCAALIALAPALEKLVPLRITDNKLLGTPLARSLPRGSLWSLSTAIDVIESPEGPLIVIDGGTAMTLVPRVAAASREERPAGLRALPYELGPGRSTLVIGSGGGVEVRAALAARSQRVLALEIDPAINALVRGRLARLTGGLFADPRVELHTAEARSYLAAHPERFDAVVAFHTISNAASATGAMSLAENYLLTVEALRLLLERLSDDGVLIMSRPEAQLGRLAATVAQAWPWAGDPRAHVAVVTQEKVAPDFLAALVVGRRPLTEAQLATVRHVTPGRIAYLPGGGGDMQEYYAAALGWRAAAARDEARRHAAEAPFAVADLEPVTDDRPFFNMPRPWSALRWSHVRAVLGSGAEARAKLEDLPVSQVAVLLLTLEALLVIGALMLGPARALRRRGIAASEGRRVGLYFGALGYAFISVEVVLIQHSTRLIGEPSWSLVAVLAVLLASTGLGSLVLVGRRGWSARQGCIAAALAALAVAWLVPLAADASAGLPFAARLGVVAGLAVPVGLSLGVPFSAGLRQLQHDELVGWAWAANSMLTVGGSVATLILGSALGFTATASIAALIYTGGAWLAGWRIAQVAAPSVNAPERMEAAS